MTQVNDLQRFIVAEVSKNWTPETHNTDTLSQRFELVININTGRGYILKDWKIFSVMHENQFNETIIAIFEKEKTKA